MKHNKQRYLDLSTKDALKLLGGTNKARDAVYGETLEYFRKSHTTSSLKKLNQIVKNCLSEVFLANSQSEIPFGKALSLALLALKKEKRKERSDSYFGDRAKQAWDRKVEEQREGQKGFEGDLIDNAKESFLSNTSPSSEEAEDHYIGQTLQPFVKWVGDAERKVIKEKPEMKGEMSKLRRVIGQVCLETAKEIRGQLLSVYAIAKHDGLDYRKLIYELRKVDFPLGKLKAKKEFLFVYPERKLLFENTYSRIKTIWKLEENHKSWIKGFISMGWSKSRTSQFMSRTICSGYLPDWYFDWLPADNSLLRRIIKKDKGLTEIYKLKELLPLLKSRKELRNDLKISVSDGKKTILTS